jgi:hypothetical protein
VVLYGISNEGMAIAFLLIVRQMLYKPLVRGAVDPAARRRGVMRFGLGALLYPVVAVVGLFSTTAMYVLYLATIVYYIADQTQLLPIDTAAAVGVVDLDEDATSSPEFPQPATE